MLSPKSPTFLILCFAQVSRCHGDGGNPSGVVVTFVIRGQSRARCASEADRAHAHRDASDER
jgi:hypothetical protein